MLCTSNQEIQSKAKKKKRKEKSFTPKKVGSNLIYINPSSSFPPFSSTPPFISTTMASSSTNQRLTRVLCLLALLSTSCHAFEFKVGGSQGWTVPSDPNSAVFNHWAEKSRFQIGDSLLFVYSSDHDSVLHVTKEDYDSCNTASPLEKYSDGHTVYKFDHSGPHYFISGVADNCRKNEKLVVVVMADRSNNGTAAVPSPPPSEATSPPSPAPSGEESPAPPPAEAEAPSVESSPPKNGVSSVAGAGVLGTLAVFFGSSLALAL